MSRLLLTAAIVGVVVALVAHFAQVWIQGEANTAVTGAIAGAIAGVAAVNSSKKGSEGS